MIHLLAASMIWAMSFGLIKHVLVDSGLHPALVSLARLAVSFLLFLPMLRVRKLLPATAVRLVAVGAVQYGVMYLAYIESFRFLPSHWVAIFTVLTPVYVTAIHDLLDRKFRRVFFGASLLASAGGGLVAWHGVGEGAMLRGFLLVQASNLCFALGQVFYRRWMQGQGSPRDRECFAFLYLGGVLVTAAPAWYALRAASCPSLPQWLTLLYLGAIPSGLGFYLWNRGARLASPGTLAVLNNAKIPLAVLCSLLVFREEANLPMLVLGGAMVGAAVFITEFRQPDRRCSCRS